MLITLLKNPFILASIAFIFGCTQTLLFILVGYSLGRWSHRAVIPTPEKVEDLGPTEEPEGDYFNDALNDFDSEGRVPTVKE